MSRDRRLGALLGLAVGDALGTTYEFSRPAQPPYPTLAAGPATEVVGGGPFDLPPGAITDDTQLAVCLARSLCERGAFDPADIARRYVAWMPGAFDVGHQTGTALDRIAAGGDPATAALAAWRDGGRRAAGNGSLMRAAPLAVWHRGEPTELIDRALTESAITHADPRCMLAVAIHDVAIAHAIAGHPGSLLAAASGALVPATDRLLARWPDERPAITAAHAELAADLAAAAAPEPDLHDSPVSLHRTAGFVRVALRLAFWHAEHTASWRAAVVDVASRGGDADTNAAIVGSLLGARDGAAAIPAAWIERVLAAPQKGSAAWGDAHHPRHLLALAEA